MHYSVNIKNIDSSFKILYENRVQSAVFNRGMRGTCKTVTQTMLVVDKKGIPEQEGSTTIRDKGPLQA